MTAVSDPLAQRLDRWVRAGLISDEQARDILAAEGAAPAQAGTSEPPATEAPTTEAGTSEPPETEPPTAVSPVAESLGYVGGVLVLVAAVTIAGRYWTAIGVGGRVAVVLGAAALLLVVGSAVPQASPAGRRLRTVSWALSVVALGFGAGLLADEGLGLRSEQVSLLAGGVAAGYAAVLYRRLPEMLQQAVLLAALAVTAGSAAALLPAGDDPVVGLAVWGLGLVWLLLGWGGIVGPWYAVDVCGGIAAVIGAQLTIEAGWGAAPALATVLGLVTAGVVLRDLALAAMGAVATLLIVPAVSQRYFPDTLGAPVTLLVAGTLLVVGALYIARRGRRHAFGDRRAGASRTAAGLAAAVAVAVAAVVVALGVT